MVGVFVLQAQLPAVEVLQEGNVALTAVVRIEIQQRSAPADQRGSRKDPKPSDGKMLQEADIIELLDGTKGD